ncbi:class E sortase [Candidatus Saccharibacteria bacterium]|nr:class E sortase [Candidatus Saccharibacteria bacterium]
MNPENGGQSSYDLQKQAAAAIARKKVLAAYAATARKNALKTDDKGGRLKDEPVTSKINSESWKKYHSAWQDYYQKYYSDYYSRAAQNYIAKERLKDAREKAEEEEILSSLTRASKKTDDKAGLSLKADGHHSAVQSSESAEDIANSLKHKIRKKATESAKKTRRHRKLIPVLAGVAVVLLILFLQYNRLIFAPIMAYVSPGNAPASQIDAIDPTITGEVSADPRLIIPKLNIDVPIRFGISLSEVMSAMNNGVAHYRIAGASAYPGEIGNVVITGHSAGDVYSSNPYKFIFSGLERLEDGDLIYVNYNSVRYTYRVVKKEVVEPSNVASLVVDTNKPILTLVTCTPLGTSRYRLLVTAEQISPSFDNASEADKITPTTDEAEVLPSNEPSFFEGIWNFLTGN